MTDTSHSYEKATFAAGCFWCTEAVFRRLKGVSEVMPGYSGGQRENPSYDQVSTGATGHAEAIQITFDPSIIPYDKLLEIFWHTHDPTTLNQQGADVGTQYRSAIFYHTEQQKIVAEKSKYDLEKSGEFHRPIVTEIIPFVAFYKAEDYHKDYFEKNKFAPYCSVVINPKVTKLLEQFRKDIKEEYQSQ